MSPNEFRDRMSELVGLGDKEVAHIMADDLTQEALRFLGYGEGADIFNSIEKWYA